MDNGTMKEKKRYWLKLDKDFLKSPQMKVIKNMTNGKDYIIFYLSLMLESVETVGHLRFTSLVPYNDEMLASVTDTNIDIVRNAVNLFCNLGMMKIFDDGTIFIPDVPKMTGKECESAERVRKYREKIRCDEIKLLPKTNAERQEKYRAKKICEEHPNVPFIEDYEDNKRYSGNYYLVMKRDEFKCSICGSEENLCVHHIDGYEEGNPQNNSKNKMMVLCRKCHSQVHNGRKIDDFLLEKINYFEESNENNEKCNIDVTKCNDNKEKQRTENNKQRINNSNKNKYGRYKRVTLTDDEYKRLCDEFGEDFITKQIEMLDEYVESNNNKNKYSNFNLVLRKSIRENWFRSEKQKKDSNSNEPKWMDEEVKAEKITGDNLTEMETLMEKYK